MALSNPRPTGDAESASPASRAAGTRARSGQKPFLGLIDEVIVEDPVHTRFDGAVARGHALSIWTWITRDIAPDIVPQQAVDAGTMDAAALDAAMPQVLARVKGALNEAAAEPVPNQRLKIALGGEDAWGRLPLVLNAIKSRALLDKAAAFGRATNTITDDAAMAAALQSMPLQDAALSALLMQAVVGQVLNPSKLLAAVVRIVGNGTDTAIMRGGFSPLIDAVLSHAQNQISALQPNGPFADIDKTCRAVDRYHRLMRALNGYVEFGRATRWATIAGALNKAASERIEPKLRDVGLDVNRSLRRPQGVDRLDSDALLAALNGVYLLATVRDCRDSLALNAVFDQVWMQTGQALEAQLTRNLDVLRASPGDKLAAERLETGIKMAELRFNAEYAEVLRRAMESAARRGPAAGQG